jgi:hypothetical protein
MSKSDSSKSNSSKSNGTKIQALLRRNSQRRTTGYLLKLRNQGRMLK